MTTALPESDSAALIKSAKQLCMVIEQGAAKFSHHEGQAFSSIFDGLNLAVRKLICCSQDPDFDRLTIIFEENPENGDGQEPVYQDTQSMTMMYGPRYIPGNDVSTNYSTVWVLAPKSFEESSFSVYSVENYITPGATMQFDYNDSKDWWDITFSGGGHPKNLISISDELGGKASMFTIREGKRIYLVSQSSVKEEDQEESQVAIRKIIVGVEKSRVRNSVDVWRRESVKNQVKLEYPIEPPTGEHCASETNEVLMCTQQCKKKTDAEASSCCSLN